MTIMERWIARKTDEDLLATLGRMETSANPGGTISTALREEAVARGLYCCGCGEKPADTLTADGSWMGCSTCAASPTHP